MNLLWDKLVGHFAYYRTLDRWPFFWRATLESLIVPSVLMAVVELFVHFPPVAPFLPRDVPKYLFIALIVGPIVELILWQWLPVMVARRYKVRFWIQVWISLVFFFLPHFGNGVSSALKGGLFSGFYTVFTYVCWRERSLREAFYMTYAVHAAHNAIAVALWWYQTS